MVMIAIAFNVPWLDNRYLLTTYHHEGIHDHDHDPSPDPLLFLVRTPCNRRSSHWLPSRAPAFCVPVRLAMLGREGPCWERQVVNEVQEARVEREGLGIWEVQVARGPPGMRRVLVLLLGL